MAITFPWTRGTEAARAANSTVPAAGMLAVTSEGNVYAADGTTAWNAAQRLAKATEIPDATTLSGATTVGKALIAAASTTAARTAISAAAVDAAGIVSFAQAGGFILYATSAPYLVKPDAREFADAAATAGSHTITSNTAAFVSSDFGKTIAIEGAGTSGTTTDLLISTITAVNSATSVTVAAAATTTVSAAVGVVGTDNTAALQAAITAAIAAKATLYLPAGFMLTTDVLTIPATLTVRGASQYQTKIETCGTTKAISITAQNNVWLQELSVRGIGAQHGIVYEYASTTTSLKQGADRCNASRFPGNGIWIRNGELFVFDGCVVTACGISYRADNSAITSGGVKLINNVWRHCRSNAAVTNHFYIDGADLCRIEFCQALNANSTTAVTNQLMVFLGGNTTTITLAHLDIEDELSTNTKTGISASGAFHRIGPIDCNNLFIAIQMGASSSVVTGGNRFIACSNGINIGTVANLNSVIEDTASQYFDPVIVTSSPLTVTGIRRHQSQRFSGQVVATSIDVTMPSAVEWLLVNASSGARVVTLGGVVSGRQVKIMKTDATANTVTIKNPSAATLGVIGAQNAFQTFMSDGVNWYQPAPVVPTAATTDATVKSRARTAAYTFPNGVGTGTGTLANGQCRYGAIDLPAVAYSKIGINVIVGGSTGAQILLGVYAEDGAGFPTGAPLATATVAATATGWQEGTIAWTPAAPGRFIVAAAAIGATTTAPQISIQNNFAPGIVALSTPPASLSGYVDTTTITATLPTTPSITANTSGPLVGLKAA